MAKDKDEKKIPTKNYKLLGRQHTGFDEDGVRKEFVAGDMVPLTKSQLEAFGDKFDHDGEDEFDPPLTPAQPQQYPDEKKDTVDLPEKTGPDTNKTGAGAAANSDNKTKLVENK